MVQRVFAFDPGTAALGWAVIEAGNPEFKICACGVRHFALTRQRILNTMKLRLKPEDRMKVRHRRKVRLMKLSDAIQFAGLAVAGEEPHWKTADGAELASCLPLALSMPLSKRLLVRVIFNVHKHRGNPAFGPEGLPAREFLSTVLATQSKWHPALADEHVCTGIMAAVFHRRPNGSNNRDGSNTSRLARLAADELAAVWHALAEEFGQPDATVIERAIPPVGERHASKTVDEKALKLLKTAGFDATSHRLLKARLYIRQSLPEAAKAVCALTGKVFDFEAAMSPAIEIDHVLPKSRGGPGGRLNLQLVFAQANRAKGAGESLAAAKPRYQAGIADSDALRRSLRLISEHFGKRATPSNPLYVSAGSVAAVRKTLLGTDETKDRTNLRHHAEDAIFTGLSSLFIGSGKVPAGLHAAVEAALAGARLSVRNERSTRGRLHDDTRYGQVSVESGFDPGTHIAARRPIENLTPAMIARIADPDLRRKVLSENLLTLTAGTSIFGRSRRVKVVHPALGHIRLSGDTGTFKAAVLPADNHHMDIVQLRDNGWKAFTVTRHDRVQPGWRPIWETNHSGGKLVMRLHKGDLVEWQSDDGSREILIVARLNGTSGIIHFARPWATSAASKLVAASPGTLKRRHARAVEVAAGGKTRFRRSNAA